MANKYSKAKQPKLQPNGFEKSIIGARIPNSLKSKNHDSMVCHISQFPNHCYWGSLCNLFTLPEAVFADCQTPVVENKLQGLWELDRINNYEAFHSASNNAEDGFLSRLEVVAYPMILERSQLYRIEQCGEEIALTVNYLVHG